MKKNIIISAVFATLLSAQPVLAETESSFNLEGLLGSIGKIVDDVVGILPIPEGLKGPILGAVIGHQIDHKDGAAVGAVLGSGILSE
jgi:hypothetical protein